MKEKEREVILRSRESDGDYLSLTMVGPLEEKNPKEPKYLPGLHANALNSTSIHGVTFHDETLEKLNAKGKRY